MPSANVLTCSETLLGVSNSQISCQGATNGTVRDTVHKRYHSSTVPAEVNSKRLKILEGRKFAKIMDDLIR